MENIILVKNNGKEKYNNIKELYIDIFGNEYFSLNEKERLIKRYEIAFYILKFNEINLKIVHTKMGTLEEKYKIKDKIFNIKSSFIIDDEKSFLCSLCKYNLYYIIEKKEVNGLLRKQQKENFKGNYVVINNLANDILENEYYKCEDK